MGWQSIVKFYPCRNISSILNSFEQLGFSFFHQGTIRASDIFSDLDKTHTIPQLAIRTNDPI